MTEPIPPLQDAEVGTGGDREAGGAAEGRPDGPQRRRGLPREQGTLAAARSGGERCVWRRPTRPLVRPGGAMGGACCGMGAD